MACALAGSTFAAVIHVRATGGSDTNDGSDWTNAVATLERAFELVGDGDTIRVAAGDYLPAIRSNPSDPRSKTVLLSSDVSPTDLLIKGGYPSTGGTDPQRDPDEHETIVSGDLADDDKDDEFDDNAYHVILFVDATEDCRVDGLTVKAGHASVEGNPTPIDGHGAGMLITRTSATANGGGVVQNCRVQENHARNGGGIAVRAYFSGQTAPFPRPSIRTTVVRDNTSLKNGGGILVDGMSAEILGCLVTGNEALGWGGGLALYSPGAPELLVVNSTVVRNRTTYPEAGGIVFDSDFETPILMDSSIVVQNEGLDQQQQVVTGFQVDLFAISSYEDSLTMNYSNLTDYATSGFTLGVGNLSYADPVFAGTATFRLDPSSPCVDSGNPDPYALPRDTYDADDEPLPDLDRRARVLDALVFGSQRVDMGAYEFTCRADFFGNDGLVGQPELTILGGSWGANPGSPADLDGDGFVGAIDQSLLLGAWGPCQQAGLGSGDPFRGENDPELHEEVLDLLAWFGFEDVASFVAWTELAGPELFCALLAQYVEFLGGGS